MNLLPDGWKWTTVGEAGRVDLGRQRSPKWHNGQYMRPYLRVKNVFEDRIDLEDVKEMDFPPEQYERFKLEPGDILLNEGQSLELVGRPAMYRGELPGVCFTNSLIRFRSRPHVYGRFALLLFRHYLHSGTFRKRAQITTNIAHLSAGRFKQIEFPLPSLDEQHRIVGVIDEQFSRLDAADLSLARSVRNLKRLHSASREVLSDGDWPEMAVGELGTIVTGSTPSTSNLELWGEGSPFFTPGDLAHGQTITDAQRELSNAGSSAARLLEAGSVLVTCIGATIGKSALTAVRSATNQQINAIVPDTRRVEPEYLLAYVCSPTFQKQIMMRASSTTMPILNKSKFSTLSVKLPPMSVQRSRVEELKRLQDAAAQISSSIGRAQRLTKSLRHTVLREAFAGRFAGGRSSLSIEDGSLSV